MDETNSIDEVTEESVHPVARALLKATRDHAHRALVADAEGEVAMAHLHGGVAVELGVKALLASVHPALISNSDEALHRLCTDAEAAVRAGSAFKTVSLHQAIKRAVRIVPSLAGMERDVETISEARNGVAHLGVSGRPPPEFNTAMLRLLGIVLDHLTVDRREFYGQFASAVASQLDAAATETTRRVKALIAAAQVRFFESYPEPVSSNLASALHAPYWSDQFESQPYDCPACGTLAVVHGEPEIDVEVDVEPDGYMSGHEYVIFIVRSFECRACGLSLYGTEAYEAGIDPVLSDVDNILPEDLRAEEEWQYYR